MASEIILPRVDMDMETGKFNGWLIGEGGRIEKGQPLFEIETDKAAMEVEAPASGVLRGGAVKPGDQLAVGAVIGWICLPDEVAPAAPSATQVPETAAAPAPADPLEAPPPAAAEAKRGRATPKARRLACEASLDIATLEGSGPNGRVQARDVQAPSAEAPAPLHYEWLSRGEGVPILFVHGFGADLAGWRPLWGRLAKPRPALAVDLPGHGRSRPEGEVSFAAFASALDATLTALGLSSIHLVGHSLGAACCAELAGRRPRLARSLTLISPAGLGPEIDGAFLAGFLAARSEPSLAPWIARLTADPAALGPALVKTTLRQRQEFGLGEWQSRVSAALFPDGTQAFSVRAALGAYAGPTKIIFGVDDPIIPHRHVRGLPGAAAVHLFSNVGHMPHIEARAEAARLLEDNFAAGEARGPA